jgi:predicted small lipoprotein YifL
MRKLILTTAAVAVVLCLAGCSKKPTPEFAPETQLASETVETSDTESLGGDTINGEHEFTDLKNDSAVLAILEEPSNVENFVPEYNWKGVKCKKYDTDDGYTHNYECSFPNANLKQVFDIIKKENINIRTVLPKTDLIDTCFQKGYKGCNGVVFKYKSKKHLVIEIGYDGGEEHFEIIEKDGNTVSKISHSID